MSEIVGGQSGEQDDDGEFNLDAEWAELNKSFEAADEEQLARMQQQAEFESVKNDVMQRMYDKNIPHVIDTDADREIELFREYVLAYQELRLEELGDADEYSIRQMAIKCIYDYFEEREYEALVLNNGTVMRYMALSQPDTVTSQIYVQLLKKQLQAELLIHYRRPMDDRWQQFLDEIVPGERLDVSRPGDLLYVHIADENLYIYEQAQLKKHYVIDEAKQLLGLNLDEDDLGEVIGTISGLLNMHSIATVPIYSEYERSNRNAELWHEARFMSEDANIVKQVVELFDDAYPIKFIGT